MESEDEFEERIVNELREASRVWGTLAGGIAFASLVALAVFLLTGNDGGAALCGFLTFMFGLVSLANWVFYRKIMADLDPGPTAASPERRDGNETVSADRR